MRIVAFCLAISGQSLLWVPKGASRAEKTLEYRLGNQSSLQTIEVPFCDIETRYTIHIHIDRTWRYYVSFQCSTRNSCNVYLTPQASYSSSSLVQEWEEVTIRLMCVDTEESQVPRGTSRHYKPITYGGKEADDWLKKHLDTNHDGRPKAGSPINVDIEFDTVEDTIVGCRRHNKENYGRLLAYVHVGGRPAGENLSLAVVRAGRSPYFTKYGRSRLYHADFLEAERLAMAEEKGLWGIMNAVGERSIPVSDYVRNYMQLLPWWNTREGIIEDFRRWQREGVATHVMVPKVNHDELVRAAVNGATITVLVDLQPKDPYLILGIMRNVSYGGVKSLMSSPRALLGMVRLIYFFSRQRVVPVAFTIHVESEVEERAHH